MPADRPASGVADQALTGDQPQVPVDSNRSELRDWTSSETFDADPADASVEELRQLVEDDEARHASSELVSDADVGPDIIQDHSDDDGKEAAFDPVEAKDKATDTRTAVDDDHPVAVAGSEPRDRSDTGARTSDTTADREGAAAGSAITLADLRSTHRDLKASADGPHADGQNQLEDQLGRETAGDGGGVAESAASGENMDESKHRRTEDGKAATDSQADTDAGDPNDLTPSLQGGELRQSGVESKSDIENRKVDATLDKINPNFDRTKSAYSENCTGVVQSYELQRRGVDAQPRPLESILRSDEGGPGGRDLGSIERQWGDRFRAADKAGIEGAFSDEGSRGVVYIEWNVGGAHVFNVENVAGKVRFVDGQPTPSVKDASHYFGLGSHTSYLRLDEAPVPAPSKLYHYVEMNRNPDEQR